MPSRYLLPSRAKQDPKLEINIDGHYESKIYTFGSAISGFVTITAHNQLPFQSLQIDLRGITSTCGHAFQYGTPFKTHTFMQLQMPISASALPISQSLEPGQLYHVPFRFVIPEQLSTTACNHQNTAVRERHLRPPPSMGVWDHDDLAGGSAHVDYVIRGRLVLSKNKRGEEQYLDQSRSIKVIPALPEQPPLHVRPESSDYCLSQTKTIRKGVIGTKMGLVRASATQPQPIVLCLDGLNATESQIPIDLEYIPASASTMPPDIRVKSVTIETFTNFWLEKEYTGRKAINTSPRKGQRGGSQSLRILSETAQNPRSYHVQLPVRRIALTRPKLRDTKLQFNNRSNFPLKTHYFFLPFTPV
ncbi:hypothetical protein NW758_013993 [Fusarium oxysporum]|nr:hypothetical protein NW758_013993 [Fusarium oxysporum]